MIKFFEYGEMNLEACDQEVRQASIRICMPCCLMQTVTPVLLGGGLIDSYELRNPIAVWVPSVAASRYKPDASSELPRLAQAVEEQIHGALKKLLDLFSQASHVLTDPGDFIPALPMGTYIRFRYRCKTDRIVDVITELESIDTLGVQEFRFAMATILANILNEWEQTSP